MTNWMLIALCVLSPFLIMWLTYRSHALNKVGSIIIAYVIGCALGLTGLVPDTDEAHAVQTAVVSAAIPVAIPLLLFSADLKAWARLAPSFIKSALFVLLGCLLSIVVGYLVCGQSAPDAVVIQRSPKSA